MDNTTRFDRKKVMDPRMTKGVKFILHEMMLMIQLDI